jgi:hypothetical protein
MDFQIIVEGFVSNNFSNVKINFRQHFLHFAVMPKDFYACLANCIGAFFETGFVAHKKGAGRPIVRTEKIVTLNKLRRTFCYL